MTGLFYTSFSAFSGINTFIQFVQLYKAVDVRGIHHRATHNLRASSQVKSFGEWSKYWGDSAEFSAEV
ncbi:hypothetical protein Prudu_011808 [Prunus dulcis]|uniref:Uncharacterized protein n=1 Tax=Prunus dulcis TaxID=3755 RepID=A0A4Y1RBE5_PRUDU|nr:hypothetical protein Prudu_011808 [Prunus dulcis]